MRILCLTALVGLFFLSSCNSNSGGRGELVGVRVRNFKQELPFGMVYVPTGSFVMGQVDQDVTISQFATNKQVTISAFYMDETEITNSEYKQFVNWVRDSIAITRLGSKADKFYIKPAQGKKPTMSSTSKKIIDWRKVNSNKGIWNDKTLTDQLNRDMYYQGSEKFYNKKELKVEQLRFTYEWVDYRKAANFRGLRDPNTNKSGMQITRDSFIVKDETYIYPDTLVWISDFTYAQNDPMTKGYFAHPSYINYPVVGVNWKQAKAFTQWRTRVNESYKIRVRQPARLPYDLPTEAQFEYAARSGKSQTTYPWGGPYIRNAKGCLLANFKPGRGNYGDDGGAFTVYSKAYFPNDFGLYNMAGNVAEWTSSIYDDGASVYVNTLNPSFDKAVKEGDKDYNKRRVVKGGSWKDVGYFLQNSARSYEYPDTARSSIGFRCILPFVGRDIKDRPTNFRR